MSRQVPVEFNTLMIIFAQEFDLRICQVFVNLESYYKKIKAKENDLLPEEIHIDLFYLENEELVSLLKEYLDHLRNKNHGQQS